jgi:opacity protein-like surface antigen
MTQFLRTCATLTTLAFVHFTATGFAGEVALNPAALQENTLEADGSTTERIERQHGPYFAAWLGAATGPTASTSGRLGGTHINDETGFAAGLKLGYYFRTPYFIRPSIEFELAYLKTDLALGGSAEGRNRERLGFSGSSDMNALVGTVNLVLALDLGSIREEVGDFLAGLHPYIGAGIGASYSSVENFDGKLNGRGSARDQKLHVEGGSKFGFAYQLMAGLEVELDDDVSLFGEYKRVSMDQTGASSIRDYETDLWIFGCKLSY